MKRKSRKERKRKRKRRFFFFFKQKTAYEIYQCDWSSDVCSSDLAVLRGIKTFIDPNVEEYLKNRSIAIMGFGKIGSGLARLFSRFTNVLVLDIDPITLEKAETLGFDTFLITDHKRMNSSAVSDCRILMSATGFPNVITSNFVKAEMDFDLYLNIGAVDEFGEDYSEEEVFMSKDKPFNFNLNPPTDNIYIDPILAAHVDGLRFLIENKLNNRIHNLPENIDNRILELFKKFNNIDISDIELYFN